jgi:hypothetical protein
MGSVLWSQFSAIFSNFRWKISVFFKNQFYAPFFPKTNSSFVPNFLAKIFLKSQHRYTVARNFRSQLNENFSEFKNKTRSVKYRFYNWLSSFVSMYMAMRLLCWHWSIGYEIS